MEKVFVIQDMETKKYFVGEPWNGIMWGYDYIQAQTFYSLEDAEKTIMIDGDESDEDYDYAIQEAFENVKAVQVLSIFINHTK